MASFKKNYLYQIVYEILAIVLPLITAPYIARVLGAEHLGVFSYTHSVANLFFTIARLGIVNHGSRSIAACQKDKDARSKVFWEIFTIQFISSALLIAAYCLYIGLFVKEDQFIAFLQVIFVASSMFDIGWLYMGMENFRKTVTKNIFVKIFSLACIFIFVTDRGDLWKYTVISAGSMLLGYWTLWFGFRKTVSWVRPKLDGILNQLKPCFVLFIPAIAVTIYTIMDKVMLGNISGSIEVGYYEQAAKLVAVPMGFITSFGAVMLPRMSAMAADKNQSEAKARLTTNSLVFMIAMSCAISFGLSAVSEHLIPLYYGPEFLPCILLLILISIKLPVMAWANVIRTQCLIPNHRDKEYIISIFCGAFVNLILNMLLIPKMGAVGAAIGTIAAESAVCLIQTVFVRKFLKIGSPLLRCSGFVVIGAIMFLVVKIVADLLPLQGSMAEKIIGLCIEIGCGVVIYLVLSLGYYCAFLEKQSPKKVIKRFWGKLRPRKAKNN